MGFVHSRLLKKRHVKTNSMIHVSDWLPTLYSAAGGNLADLGQIDGVNQWDMLQVDGPSVRNEILHNIDPKSKFSAIRVGDYKLVQGDISGGRNDGWYLCTPPIDDSNFTNSPMEYFDGYVTEMEIRREKRGTPNTPFLVNCGDIPENYTETCFPTKEPCLFHIPTDPCEYFNIAKSNPDIVKNLLGRIEEYSKTAVEPVNKPIDKLANPSFHGGVWVPWQGSGFV